MIPYVVRKILIVLGIILIAVAVWLYIGVSRVIQSENDVKSRFREIVQYYVSMDQDYVVPLLSSGELQAGDSEALRSIDRQMKDLGATVDMDQQYPKLLALQKTIIPFVGSTVFPEAFMNDSRLQAWNKNATNLGGASSVIKSYNEALSIYNTNIHSAAGQLAGLWKRWSHHQYLSIDGTLQDQTQVSF